MERKLGTTSITISLTNRAWLADLQKQLAVDRGLGVSQDTVDHVLAHLRDIYEEHVRRVTAEWEQGA